MFETSTTDFSFKPIREIFLLHCVELALKLCLLLVEDTVMKFLQAMTCALFLFSSTASATIGLYDWGFNIDGTTHCNFGLCDFDGVVAPGGLPASIDASLFDFGTGLGTVSVMLGGAGARNVAFFVDHEIDEFDNTYFNENGIATGAPAAGQTWEIDEPGYVFGDIFDNFLVNALDNTSGVSPGSEDDVSMALGWDFSLVAGDTAKVSFTLSDTTVPGGFYLTQTDPDSALSLYFSSALSINSTVIPEPSYMIVLTMMLAGLGWVARKRSAGLAEE